MNNSVANELNTLLVSCVLGIAFGVIFDVFRAFRYGRAVSLKMVVFQDIVYFVIITVLTFETILSANGAELRLYMPIASLTMFLLYRTLLSKKILMAFVLIKNICFKIFKTMVKIIFFPLIKVVQLTVSPFLALKNKLLRKKVKFALTFRQICFKIKCSVGMLTKSNNVCKERRTCRKKRKPEKRV